MTKKKTRPVELINNATEYAKWFTPVYANQNLKKTMDCTPNMYLNYGYNDISVVRTDKLKVQIIYHMADEKISLTGANHELISSLGPGTYLFLPKRNKVVFTYEADGLEEKNVTDYEEWKYKPDFNILKQAEKLYFIDAYAEKMPFKVTEFNSEILIGAFYSGWVWNFIECPKFKVTDLGVSLTTLLYEKDGAGVPGLSPVNARRVLSLFELGGENVLTNEQTDMLMSYVYSNYALDFEHDNPVDTSGGAGPEKPAQILDAIKKLDTQTKRKAFLEETKTIFLSDLINYFHPLPKDVMVDVIQDVPLTFSPHELKATSELMWITLGLLERELPEECLEQELQRIGLENMEVDIITIH